MNKELPKFHAPFDWSKVNLKEVEERLLATVPEGRNPQDWFREQYLCRPVSFEPQK